MTGISCGGSRPSTPRRKKRGLMSSLYAAFFGAAVTTEAHAKKHKSPESPTGASNPGGISRLVSSIRPLHIADGGQSPQSPKSPISPKTPISPASPSMKTANSTTSKTSYASADFGDRVFEVDEDLKSEKKEEEIVSEKKDVPSEELITVKAERMIGKFYQQIRLQALNSIGAATA